MTRPAGPWRTRTWLTGLKTRLGYYELRRRLRRPFFVRALRPTDTFLVGHPKSGNTWLAYMLAILLHPERAREITLLNVGDYVPFVHGRDDRIGRHAGLPDPRVFRNEDPQYPDLYPRVIYLVRDPRAALVSFWHMYRTMFDRPDFAFDAFLDDYLRSGGIFQWWNSKLVRWDRQVAGALRRSDAGERMKIVRYEDMVADRGETIRILAAFLEIAPGEDILDRAVRRGGFDEMRAVEERHGAEAYTDRAAGEGRFIRRGRVDGWRDEIDADQEERIVEALGPVMERLEYT